MTITEKIRFLFAIRAIVNTFYETTFWPLLKVKNVINDLNRLLARMLYQQSPNLIGKSIERNIYFPLSLRVASTAVDPVRITLTNTTRDVSRAGMRNLAASTSSMWHNGISTTELINATKSLSVTAAGLAGYCYVTPVAQNHAPLDHLLSKHVTLPALQRMHKTIMLHFYILCIKSVIHSLSDYLLYTAMDNCFGEKSTAHNILSYYLLASTVVNVLCWMTSTITFGYPIYQAYNLLNAEPETISNWVESLTSEVDSQLQRALQL